MSEYTSRLQALVAEQEESKPNSKPKVGRRRPANLADMQDDDDVRELSEAAIKAFLRGPK